MARRMAGRPSTRCRASRRQRRSVTEPLHEPLAAVGLARLGVRDRDAEALLPGFRDRQRIGRGIALVGELAVQRVHIDAKALHPRFSSLKKSFPLSSITMKAGKSTTSMRQIASMPSSGYSSVSTFLMQCSAKFAAAPPMLAR